MIICENAGVDFPLLLFLQNCVQIWTMTTHHILYTAQRFLDAPPQSEERTTSGRLPTSTTALVRQISGLSCSDRFFFVDGATAAILLRMRCNTWWTGFSYSGLIAYCLLLRACCPVKQAPSALRPPELFNKGFQHSTELSSTQEFRINIKQMLITHRIAIRH